MENKKDKRANLQKLLWCGPVLRNLLEARIYEVSKIIRPVARKGGKKSIWINYPVNFESSLRHQDIHIWVLLLERVGGNQTDPPPCTTASDIPNQAKAHSYQWAGSCNLSFQRKFQLKNMKTRAIWEQQKFCIKANTHSFPCQHLTCQILCCTNSSRPKQSFCPALPPVCRCVSSSDCINTPFLKCLQTRLPPCCAICHKQGLRPRFV